MTFGVGAIGEYAIGEDSSVVTGGGGGGGTGATAAQIWAYEITSGVTAGAALLALYQALSNGRIMADVRAVNAIQVDGTGTDADPWGPV